MKRREFIKRAALGVGAAWAAGRSWAAPEAAGRRRPNVVVFVADDMGFADCGPYGCTDIPTPALDALARNGARFTHAYTSGCVCSPTRAGFITGRYQQRFGFDANAEGANPGDKAPRALDLQQVTFAQRLKALGYATGIIGKWHLGAGDGYLPTQRGFDEFLGFLPFGLGAAKEGKPLPIYRGLEEVTVTGNHMETFCTEALSFIDRHREAPFFLYFPMPAVHGPMVGPEPYLSRFKDITPPARRRYAADLSQMDDVIGRIMARLRESGLAEDTLVVFFSDNGGSGGPTRNGPYRGTKWTLWEGGIHVPMMVQWPGRIPAGRTLDQPVMQIDILPTAIAAAGGQVQPDWKLDGANLLPLLAGTAAAAPHEALYWRFGVQYAVRQGDWKLVKAHVDQPARLFNLAQDPGEKDDRSGQEAARAKGLQALWDAWNAGNEAPRWIDVRWNGDGPAAKKAPARRAAPAGGG